MDSQRIDVRNRALIYKNLFSAIIEARKKKPIIVNRNKEYACGFCPKVFTKRCDWRIHKKQQHTYEMKLMVMKKCDYCEELFPNDKQLSKHIKLKHEIGKHLCDECGKEYSSHK